MNAEEIRVLTKAFETQNNSIESLAHRQGDLQARLLDIEQKACRPGGGTGAAGEGEGVGSLVVKADGLDQLRTGELKTLRVAFKGFPPPQASTLLSTGFPGRADRDNEIYGQLPRRMTVQDLIIRRPTTAGSIEYVKAARVGAAAVQLVGGVTEGVTKAELGVTAELATSKVVTIAGWTAASRQVLDDNQQLQDFIDSDLRDALDVATEAQILFGSGLTGNLRGLMLDATPFTRYVSGDKHADRLRRAATDVQLARGVPTGAVINPIDLEKLELTKDSQGRYLMSYEVTDNNGRTVVFRVPTIATDAMPEDSFLVADFSRAVRIWDRQQAVVLISTEHSDFMTRNLVLILAELRIATTIPRPALLVKGTFSAQSDGA